MKKHREDKRKITLENIDALDLILRIDRFSIAADLHSSATREEKQGHPLTAAMQWRRAAGLFIDEFLSECCWREWERIMKLPRALAQPF
jgi:hypothetical protein